MAAPLKLISHKLCPYVQRAVIALTEKGVPFERIDIDLANKPDWFLKVSPLGKTPVLLVGDHAIFESAVILEYLEETQANPLHPADALRRAEHRACIEFGSAVLNDIAGLYSAPDEAAFKAKAAAARSERSRVWKPVSGRAVVRRREILAGRCGVRSRLPLFRRVRRDRRFRDSRAVSRSLRAGATLSPRGLRSNRRSARIIRRLLRDFIDRRRSYLSQLQANVAA